MPLNKETKPNRYNGKNFIKNCLPSEETIWMKDCWNRFKMDHSYTYRAIGLISRVFVIGWGDRSSILDRVIPKTQKMRLDASKFNTQHYKIRIKGKVEQSKEGVAPSPTRWCSSYWKGNLRSPTKVANFTYLDIYIYTYIYTHISLISIYVSLIYMFRICVS